MQVIRYCLLSVVLFLDHGSIAARRILISPSKASSAFRLADLWMRTFVY